MKIEFELTKEQRWEIVMDWIMEDPHGLVKALGSYRHTMLTAMPEEEIREFIKHRDYEIERFKSAMRQRNRACEMGSATA